jgi:hydrogenase maturation protease
MSQRSQRSRARKSLPATGQVVHQPHPATGQDARRHILIACIGNIFLGDDGFGVAVAERLRGRPYAAGVEVVDFGIRGVELAYTLLDGCDTLVLVDAVARGGAPGTLYLIEPDPPASAAAPGWEAARVPVDAHSMDPLKVLAFAHALGARPGRTLVVGCEPAPAGDNDADTPMSMELSEPVRAALDEAVRMIDALIARLSTDDETGGLP